jgi:eukaryotic-like serine/threonine-protein kinase
MPLENLQNGRYQFSQQLGSGSMGEVYLVDDTVIGRKVAIKVMRVDPATRLDTEAVQNSVKLFKREAQAIAKLEHPNILPLYDFGEEKQEQQTFTYMVMPYCQEGSLLNWLQQHYPKESLSPEMVGYFIELAANALQYAHTNGIIHQDVKPSNFLVRAHNNGKDLPDLLLADFGIARVSTGTTVNTTNFGPKGTPRYMPPEQWEGKPLPASDQYALAIMAYQLLTRVYPIQGEQLHQVMYQHFHTIPQPPSKFNQQIPTLLDGVILRALAKKPEERFSSISAFATAFRQAIQGQAYASQTSNEFATVPYDIDAPSSTMPTQNAEIVPAPRTPLPPPPVVPIHSFPLDHAAPTQQNTYHPPQDRAPQPMAHTRAPGPDYEVQPVVAQPVQQLIRPNNTPAGQPSWQPQVFSANVPYQQTPLPPSNWTEPRPGSIRPDTRETRPDKGISPGKALLFIGLTLVVVLAGWGAAYYVLNLKHSQNNVYSLTPTPDQGNIYTTSMPTLRYTDPLSQPYFWTSLNDNATQGGCNFQQGSYDVTTNKAGTYTLCRTSNQPVVGAMTFEVQMQILHGDCGGIVFRGNLQTNNYYYFDLCSSGGYFLCTYNGTNDASPPLLPASQPFPTLKANPQAKITVAIVAQGTSLTFYLNHQQVAQLNNSTFASGQISLFSYSGASTDVNNPAKEATEVVFSNARLWTP